MLFELFSDIFTIRQNRLTRVDPRLKLLVAAGAVLMTLSASGPIFPMMVFAASLFGGLALSVPIRHLLLRFAAPFGMAGMILALKTFMTAGAPIFTLTMAGLVVTATEQGLSQGALLGARVLGAMGILQLFGFVTPAHHLFRGLMWIGAPRGWVEVAMLMYRFTFDIFERAADVASAQRTRLGYSNASQGLASAGTLAGAVLLGAMDKAGRVEEAMIARGYTGAIPYDPPPRLVMGEVLAAVGGAMSLAIIFITLELI